MRPTRALILTLALCCGCSSGGGGGSSTSGSPSSSSGPSSPSSGGSGGSTAPTSTNSSGGSSGGVAPTAVGQVFPADNPWNRDVSSAPVHPDSSAFIASIGADTGLHPDFGTVWNGAPNGIPYVLVDGATQARVPITFTAYGNESDPGPYPIPTNAPIEGGPSGTGDRHVLCVDTTGRKLYELFNARPNGSGGWDADSGAVFDLQSNALRPAGWTSADAAGLPVFPGLIRYDEAVEQGEIRHALRFTVVRSQRGYVDPARHFASSSTDPTRPPMGLRLRLKASVDISGYPAEVQVILRALKRYGMFVADNGSNWYLSGAPDSRWSDSNLARLSQIKGRDFEVVDTGPIVH